MFRILIADDEPMIRKGLQKLIQQSGQPIASLRLAENGADALQQIQEERPDFLFTDIRMPKMDGLELCRQVAELDPDIHIVVVSGYNDFEYAQKCVSYGVKEYILKPINKKAVETALVKLAHLRAKQMTQAFVSVNRLEEWVAVAEDAIWSLKHTVLLELLLKARSELTSYNLRLNQLVDLLGEFSVLLNKRLNERDVFSFSERLQLYDVSSIDEAWTRFEASLELLFQDLRIKRKGKLRDPVEEAKHYIEDHLAEEVSLEEVADRIGLNASYFSQLFKQSTQETFVQYRTRRRIEKAKKLLAQPHYRITDISGEVGYADHPHFTKTFKKYTGLLPSEFRNKLGIE
ncbi:response regulator transcription factor [Paenibacillus radicis (ex Xue et al. 2023)]|uniref:Response regulator n=1 Tax=Paenibacillus radicis (ex Xue et al. 2023) TaxID=2972489 RepID=A0ABT1YNI5_9BACL|nr:response regulator [Paenibacillus radicis (ex Xue et al. 2023)]MCR8633555.1 response regulator [Paenibacillus radicis (ex Xue et al. 2023)]